MQHKRCFMPGHRKHNHSSSNKIDRWIAGLLGSQPPEKQQSHRDTEEKEGEWIAGTAEVNPPVVKHRQRKMKHKHHKQPERQEQNMLTEALRNIKSWLKRHSEASFLKKVIGHPRLRQHRHARPYIAGSQANDPALTATNEAELQIPEGTSEGILPAPATVQRPARRKKARSSRGKHFETKHFLIWKYLPRKWQGMWENLLYSLFLRDAPHDPFLKEEPTTKHEPVSVKIANELTYFISSLTVFLAAGLSAWLFYQLSVMLVASFFNIDSVLYYYEVMFPIGNASTQWTPLNIIAITLAGPLASLFGGLFTYFYLIRRKVVRGFNRLFFLWLAFHLFNQFFGGFVAGIITDQGFGYVANWMFLGIVLKILFSLIALSILAYAGYYVVPWLLATAGNPIRIRRENRFLFVTSQAVLPWLFGSLILLALRDPDRTPQHPNIMVYDAIIAGALGVMTLAMYFNRHAKPASVSHRKTNYRAGFIWAVATITALVLVRAILAYGLHVVLTFSFHIGLFN